MGMFMPPRSWTVFGWEIWVTRSFPKRPWIPRVTRMKNNWKRGWGYRGGLLNKGGDLRWLTLYVTLRKSR